jgi:pre-rRNA-processing protein IPI3
MSPIPSETLLIASSSSATASGSTTLHELSTAQLLLTLKPSSALPNCTASVPTRHGKGGIVMAVQEGKALAGVWAWQKVRQPRCLPRRPAAPGSSAAARRTGR